MELVGDNLDDVNAHISVMSIIDGLISGSGLLPVQVDERGLYATYHSLAALANGKSRETTLVAEACHVLEGCGVETRPTDVPDAHAHKRSAGLHLPSRFGGKVGELSKPLEIEAKEIIRGNAAPCAD